MDILPADQGDRRSFVTTSFERIEADEVLVDWSPSTNIGLETPPEPNMSSARHRQRDTDVLGSNRTILPSTTSSQKKSISERISHLWRSTKSKSPSGRSKHNTARSTARSSHETDDSGAPPSSGFDSVEVLTGFSVPRVRRKKSACPCECGGFRHLRQP